MRCSASKNKAKVSDTEGIFRLASLASHPDTQEYAAENLWYLVALIQRATLQLVDDEVDASSDLSSALASSPQYIELVRSCDDLSETVALHQRETHAAPVELLQHLLRQLEAGSGSSIGRNRLHRVAVDSLKDSIHRYLRASLQHKAKLETVDQLVQRSMYHFAYGLSHEINNPLANISARASELAATESGERKRKSLKTIVDQAMKAHEMLAEMMLAVKMPELSFVASDLRGLMLEISHEWRGRSADRNIVWNAMICDDFLWSNFDRVALSEAISAGIRNALEACRSGDSLSLIAQRSESAQGELEIRIAIVDNGPGLSQESLDHAWNLYFSGREAGRGLGIGLAKVRRIIEAHQGRVWLASKARQGCTMEIRLPWKRVPSVA